MSEKNVIDSFFQQLEEKVMALLSEREDSLKENQRLHHEITILKQENAALKTERENHTHKLEGIVSLLESITGPEKLVANTNNLGTVKLDLIQG